jgi:hypothetical protein
MSEVGKPEGSPSDEKKENKEDKIKVHWSEGNENMLVEWADVAQCYKWLNAKAHADLSYKHAWFTIPAITLSTISGTASFAQASLPANIQAFAPAVIGSLNIFIGILTTVQQYLKISELNEAHRVSSISWDKFARNIRIELSKAPHERMDAGPFIKICRQEFDRLMETSPMIPQKIIDEFKKKFRYDKKFPETKFFQELRKPDICDVIISAERYRYGYIPPEHRDIIPEPEDEEARASERALILFRSRDEEIQEKERILRQKELEEQEKKRVREEKQKSFQKTVIDAANRVKQQQKHLEDYVVSFQNMYGRKPIVEEINTHAKDLIAAGAIDEMALTKFLNKYDMTGISHMV